MHHPQEIKMKLPRRKFLHLAAGAAALPAFSPFASAQTYPTRPVRWIVVAGPGSSPDIVARLVGQRLSERLGQPIIIDNRPGGGSNIGTQAVVNAPPDGYTLLFVTNAQAINATLYDKLNYNFMRDIAPVAPIVRVPFVMLVNPSLPAKTVPEFVAYSKANPGKLTMASAGIGTVSHVAGELFKRMTDVNVLTVPYRTGPPALTDLIAGNVQVMFDTLPSSIEHVRTGRLRALATVAPTRSELLPDIPIIADFVPGYEASALFGVGVPRNTPPEIVGRLNKEINALLEEPEIKARVADIGMTVALSPAEYGKLIADETEKWAKVIRAANIKPE
jgi:tripartite-type tricarboxylate transporter receptor subunit TctC